MTTKIERHLAISMTGIDVSFNFQVTQSIHVDGWKEL